MPFTQWAVGPRCQSPCDLTHSVTCSNGYANDKCDGNAIHPLTCAGKMLMTMLIVLSTPMVMRMLVLIAMVLLMLLGHSTGNGHSPLTCGNGDGNAIHPGASCHSPCDLWELDAPLVVSRGGWRKKCYKKIKTICFLAEHPNKIRWTRKTTIHEQITNTYQQLRGLVLNVWTPSTCKILKQAFSRTLENTFPHIYIYIYII